MPAAPEIAPSSRPRRRGEDTAERILDAAEAIFAEKGYAGATLRDVAARVGIRNPSLYNHFSSKESLYVAVLERGLDPVIAALRDFLAPENEAYRDARRVVERIMQLLARRPELPRLILHESLAGGERLTPLLETWIAPAFGHAYAMMEATPAARRWDSEQIPLLVLAMYHIVVGYFAIAPLYRELNGEDLLSEPALARQTALLNTIADQLFAEDEL